MDSLELCEAGKRYIEYGQLGTVQSSEIEYYMFGYSSLLRTPKMIFRHVGGH